MPTLTATRTPAADARPAVSEGSLLVGATTTSAVAALHELPAPGADEFFAVLGAASPGAPVGVVGRRTAGRAYDHLTVDYRAEAGTERQTWTLVADLGSEVTYRLLEDTGARGGFAALPR